MITYLIYHDHTFFNPETEEKLCNTVTEADKYLASCEKMLFLVCKECGFLSSNFFEHNGSQGMCSCNYPFYILPKEVYDILIKLSKRQRLCIINNKELRKYGKNNKI